MLALVGASKAKTRPGAPIAYLAGGVGLLVLSCAAGAVLPAGARTLAVLLGVAAFLFCWRRGLRFWALDEIVLDRPPGSARETANPPIRFPRKSALRPRAGSAAPESPRRIP